MLFIVACLMLTHFQSLPQLFEQFPQLFAKLEELFPQPQKVAIAVSGGSDSMFLSFVILTFRKEKNRDLNQIFFLHCNHGMRVESSQEADFLSSFFAGYHLQIFEREVGGKCNEEALRNRRYQAFSTFMQKNEIACLLTGHHLNDRIESTFLNLIRGCGLKGLIAMQEREFHYLLEGKQVLRPLLFLKKKSIEDFCVQCSIPFCQDQSNFDPKTSRRNLLRTQIFEPLLQIGEANQFLDSRQKVYESLENQIETQVLQEEKCNPYLAKSMFSFVPVSEEKKLKSQIFAAFSQLDMVLREGEVHSLCQWLLQGQSGIRRVQGRTLVLSHEKLYFLPIGEEKRREEMEGEKEILQGGIQNFGFFTLQVPEELVGAKLRFPRAGDKFRGKSFSKWAINQKIPIFWRNALPLAEREGKIIFVWTPALLEF